MRVALMTSMSKLELEVKVVVPILKPRCTLAPARDRCRWLVDVDRDMQMRQLSIATLTLILSQRMKAVMVSHMQFWWNIC